MVVLVLENGASTIKAGLVDHSSTDDPRIIANAVVRSKGDKTTYIGHELESCKDYSSLSYRLPLEKACLRSCAAISPTTDTMQGYVVDWDAQKAVWDGILSDEVLNVNPTESTILLTEPYFNLPKNQEVYDQFIFEEYEFQAYVRSTPASLIPHGTLFDQPGLLSPECMLIVDSGFSFTHVVPLMEGKVVWSAVKRLDVGGKLLTNQLKELVSFRQWNMMDETYIMNHVKETCCFVTQDFQKDIETCRSNPKKNPIVQEYLLPDLTKSKMGENTAAGRYPTRHGPDDIGLDQSGLPAVIAASISLLPDDLQGMFWANIGLIGGNTKIPGFRRRLLSELRSLAPVEYEVVLHQSSDPVLDAYRAAIAYASDPSVFVTRAEYLESGSVALRRKVPDWQPAPPPLREPTIKEKEKDKPKDKERPSAREKVEPAKTKGKGKGRQREEVNEELVAPAPKHPKTRVRLLNPIGPTPTRKR
ncbi:Actin-like protein ARP6 [Mycena venus]|uniref:Actin-like protein ARP6 n=1 Tax=Mycena venus TaxID=2733690 RepID=A0A8H6Y9D9_9AGAR|nr:Actin-like protein ARP6 [Mycena venus]